MTLVVFDSIEPPAVQVIGSVELLGLGWPGADSSWAFWARDEPPAGGPAGPRLPKRCCFDLDRWKIHQLPNIFGALEGSKLCLVNVGSSPSQTRVQFEGSPHGAHDHGLSL